MRLDRLVRAAGVLRITVERFLTRDLGEHVGAQRLHGFHQQAGHQSGDCRVASSQRAQFGRP